MLPFRKRAQLAVADLARAGVAPGLDLSPLTMFADNLVPHVLRLDGILDASSPALVARIEREELIDARLRGGGRDPRVRRPCRRADRRVHAGHDGRWRSTSCCGTEAASPATRPPAPPLPLPRLLTGVQRGACPDPARDALELVEAHRDRGAHTVVAADELRSAGIGVGALPSDPTSKASAWPEQSRRGPSPNSPRAAAPSAVPSASPTISNGRSTIAAIVVRTSSERNAPPVARIW